MKKCRDALADSLQRLADYTKDTPVCVCIENCPDTVPDVETILTMIESAERQNLGCCLDTGHLNLSTPGAGHFIRKCGGRLRALHLNDNPGMHDRSEDQMGYWYADDIHLMPGTFVHSVDWADVIAALHEINYSGLWNLEIPGEFRNLPDDLRELKLKQCFEWSKALFCGNR